MRLQSLHKVSRERVCVCAAFWALSACETWRSSSSWGKDLFIFLTVRLEMFTFGAPFAMVVPISTGDACSIIRRGGIYVQEQWLKPEVVQSLRDEVTHLKSRNQFARSGVATSGIDGAYGRSDRQVCVLGSRLAFQEQLDEVCLDLSRGLGRPSLACAEQYYSISSDGARLGLHMDERHEETKGESAWGLSTRRSISWLVYLSADGWDDMHCGGAGAGGCLRAYCRRTAGSCGAHEGNLQVGWLDGTDQEGDVSVFLDSWRRRDGEDADHAPLSALYHVVGEDGDARERRYLTANFGPESPSWQSSLRTCQAVDGDGMSPAIFYEALRAQLRSPQHRDQFSSVEMVPHPRQEIVDVSPRAGTLVLFCSVAVPHEVLPTLAGERVALAGWLHEEQQTFPEWFG